METKAFLFTPQEVRVLNRILDHSLDALQANPTTGTWDFSFIRQKCRFTDTEMQHVYTVANRLKQS
jgi:hypothetical protein